MTASILNLMKERRRHKTKSLNKFKQVLRNIRKKIREKEKRQLYDKCKEIGGLDKRYGSFNMNKRIQEMTDTKNNTVTKIDKNEEGRIITNMKKKLLE